MGRTEYPDARAPRGCAGFLRLSNHGPLKDSEPKLRSQIRHLAMPPTQQPDAYVHRWRARIAGQLTWIDQGVGYGLASVHVKSMRLVPAAPRDRDCQLHEVR